MTELEAANEKYYLSKATDQIRSGNLQHALDTYYKCLAEYPGCIEAYNNVSIILNERLSTNFAIKFMKKGVIIKPELAALYRNLGIFYLEIGCDQKALRALSNACKISPGFADVFFNLGNLFTGYSKVGLESYVKASQLYKKSIALNPFNATAYLNLADLYANFSNLDLALFLYKRSLLLEPIRANTYQLIGDISFEKGHKKKSLNAYEIFIKYNPLVYQISTESDDMIRSCKAIDYYQSIDSIPSQAIFIPSYPSDFNNTGTHLMYLHIPKCGGTRFEDPLVECIKQWYINKGIFEFKDYLSDLYEKNEFKYILFEGRGSALYYEFFRRKIPYDMNIDFSFFRSYQINISNLLLDLKEKCNIRPIKIAAYRNPEKRLLSAIRHLLRTNGNRPDLVRECIKDRDIFLDNSIYRACYDSFDTYINLSSVSEPVVDSLIELGDFSQLCKIQSEFLSNCRLPNIITNKFIHKSPPPNKSDYLLIDKLKQECLDNGFLEYDNSQLIQDLLKPEYSASLQKDKEKKRNLHPITLILSTRTSSHYYNKSILMPTSELLTAKGQRFLREVFGK